MNPPPDPAARPVARAGDHRLDLAAADKPLDVGNGRLAASIGTTGQVQAVSILHSGHGCLVLSNDPDFADDRRHDVAAVRRHRRRLAAPDGPGLGIATTPAWTPRSAVLEGGTIPRLVLDSNGLQATVTTWAPTPGGSAGLVQAWDLANDADRDRRFVGRLTGLGRLGRASLTQLTEGGVVPAPDATTTSEVRDGTVVLLAPAVPGVAAIRVELVNGDGDLETLPPPEVDLPLPVGGRARLVLRLSLAETIDDALGTLESLGPETLGPTRRTWAHAVAAVTDPPPAGDDSDRPGDQADLGPVVARAATYATGCCTVAVDDATAVLTDHRILPLTWTRDAYWTITALAEARSDAAADLVRGHLAWLFGVAERPDGTWARSYLPNGAIKDPAHQLDQQCYPLLEALDHLHRTGDLATVQRHAPAIRDVAMRLLADQHSSGLLATEETPADDPLELPFHLSSNLLVAHTFRELATADQLLDLDEHVLLAAVERCLAAISRHFTIEVDGQTCWAYATDLVDTRWYHDANDIPTVLAPRWGLDVPVDTWRSTMELAFSPANPDGFFDGPFGGLGSVHTPGAWPLGDAQELLFAALTDDPARAATVQRRLAATASWDGSLPECRDPRDGTVRSRHWFAWPGCMVVLARQLLADKTAGHW